jgi:uncharacterized protein (DUF1919 family)
VTNRLSYGTAFTATCFKVHDCFLPAWSVFGLYLSEYFVNLYLEPEAFYQLSQKFSFVLFVSAQKITHVDYTAWATLKYYIKRKVKIIHLFLPLSSTS